MQTKAEAYEGQEGERGWRLVEGAGRIWGGGCQFVRVFLSFLVSRRTVPQWLHQRKQWTLRRLAHPLPIITQPIYDAHIYIYIYIYI